MSIKAKVNLLMAIIAIPFVAFISWIFGVARFHNFYFHIFCHHCYNFFFYGFIFFYIREYKKR